MSSRSLRSPATAREGPWLFSYRLSTFHGELQIMGLMDKFATNENLEVDGVWNQFDESFRVRIARASTNNIRYAKALEKATKPFRRNFDMVSSEMQLNILKEVYAKTIVTGWQTNKDGEWVDGINLEGDEIIPLTPENVLHVFKVLPDLFATIQQFADDAAAYRQAALEKEGKN